MRNEDIMAYIEDISVNMNNNYYLFKHDLDYV